MKLKQNNIEITARLSKIFTQPKYSNHLIDKAMEAALFIVEDEYVDQSPADIGDLKGGIQVRKVGNLEYSVDSTVVSDKGEPYSLFLYTGTGSQYGKPDNGFTTGHVRANTVAYGIGGVRPNKAADRATENSKKDYRNKVEQLLMIAIRR